MFLYTVVFIISSVCIYFGSNKLDSKKIYIFIGVTFPILVAGLRGLDVGTDTKNYLVLYETVKSVNGYLPIVEPFYFIVGKIGAIFNMYPVVLIIYQGLTVFFLYLFSIRSGLRSKMWVIFFLYFMILFNPSLNIMRQCLAVTYLLFIFSFLWKREYLKYFLYGLLGCTFHSSIIVGLIFYYIIYKLVNSPIRFRTINILFYFLGCCILIIIFPFILSLISTWGGEMIGNKAEIYQKNAAYVSWTYLGMSFFMLMIYMIVSHYSLLKRDLSDSLLLFIITEFYFSILGSYNAVFSRFTIYFTAGYIYFIPKILECYRIPKNQKRVLSTIIILFFYIYWFWIIIYNKSNETIPYYLNNELV